VTADAEAGDDIPYSEDLQSLGGAAAWVEDADCRRPRRVEIRRAITTRLRELRPGSRVLELGSGPGLLAEEALRECPHLGGYTLLDFSEPMLEMCRARLAHAAVARFLLEDFRSGDWVCRVDGPYDAVVTMQAAHEVRHKRRIPALFEQVSAILVPSGIFLMCDRVPEDDAPRSTTLFMTTQEQERALLDAGFENVRLLLEGDALALYACRKPAVAST
jgi:cyclopropane fatty-acyl-phospholipid synthase-like methyltransferase